MQKPASRSKNCDLPGLLQESLGPFGPEVSPESTLGGHSQDTFWTLRSLGPKGPRRHPVGHSLGHPRFQRHSRGHSGDTKGPRESCSRLGGFATQEDQKNPKILFSEHNPGGPKIEKNSISRGNIEKNQAFNTE